MRDAVKGIGAGVTGRHARALAIAALALTLGGCFRGEFLNRTCEQLGTCDDTTTTATTGTSTTGTSTTGGSTTTGSLGEDVLAFRVSTLEIVDPHFYLDLLECTDVTDIVNLAILPVELDKGEFNVALLFPEFDAQADAGELVIQQVACDVPNKMCYRDGASIYGYFGNNYASDCLEIPEEAIQPVNRPQLNEPLAPCFLGLEGTVFVTLPGSPVPLELRNGRVAARYDDPEDPQLLVDGVIRGFVTEEQARALSFTYMGMETPLWSMIAGAEGCAHPSMPPPDTETLEISGAPVNGFWLFANFTAEKVSWTPEMMPTGTGTGTGTSTGGTTDATGTGTGTGTATGSTGGSGSATAPTTTM